MNRRVGDDPYKDLRDALSSYWNTYGGFRAFWKSPFTHGAIVIELCCLPLLSERGWPDFVLTFLPPILGFTLAGYALVFAFGDDNFRRIMAGSHAREGQPVFYLHISATYLHFIMVQALAIAFAVVAKADPARSVYYFIGGNFPAIVGLHTQLRYVGDAVAIVGFFPCALAITNAVAAALAINSIIDLYVHLYRPEHTAAQEAPLEEAPLV